MNRNLSVIRRDDCSFELSITDVNQNPVDITGGLIHFTVKKKLSDDDTDAVIRVEVDTFEDPVNGLAVLNLTREDTDKPALSYFYDIQLELDNKVTSSLRGKFNVVQDVTVNNTLDDES